MARGVSNLNLQKVLRALGEEHGDSVPLPAVGDIIEKVLRSQKRKHSAETRTFKRELDDLVSFIETTKDELAELNPKDIKVQHLAPAADELDAIVAATEGATNTILDNVEEIEERCRKCGEEGGGSGAGLREPVTAIFEACTFQDITGQRISKVVTALREIEERIEAMSAALQLDVADGAPRKRKTTVAKGDKPSDEDLLNGPQLTAAKQAEIDALFDSLD